MIRRQSWVIGLLLCSGCGMSPLSNRIEIGKNPFVVFVGEGIDHHTDLFAAETGGGRVFQLTFSPVVELQPRLLPDGSMVAFLRMKDTLPQTPRTVVVMNLVTGAERQLELPAGAGSPMAIAWSDDFQWIYIATERGRWRVAAPPRATATERIADADLDAADSVLGRWAGLPRFARIIPCPMGGVCLIPPNGDTIVIAATGHDGFPWGADSLAWFDNDELIVRSLGAGTLRRVAWKSPPSQPRDGTYAGQ